MVAPGGACMVALGGCMHGFIWGACMVLFRGGGHAWFYSGACMVLFGGGMRGFIQGGMHGFIQGEGMHGFFSFFRYNEIRSMSRRYASYWNAFLSKMCPIVALKRLKKCGG